MVKKNQKNILWQMEIFCISNLVFIKLYQNTETLFFVCYFLKWINLFILAAPGLNWGTRDLHCSMFSCGMRTLSVACTWDLVPWPGIEPWAPCLGSAESYPLDHQGSPVVFKIYCLQPFLCYDGTVEYSWAVVTETMWHSHHLARCLAHYKPVMQL